MSRYMIARYTVLKHIIFFWTCPAMSHTPPTSSKLHYEGEGEQTINSCWFKSQN